ncbi:hypothetical protein [Dokdonia sp.]|uniref:ArnT family glycosyltransferase n=1 Tax=Dokdonia sp. TaxID=2024995 RepID=UPI003264286D
MTLKEKIILSICFLFLILEFFFLTDIPAFWDATSKFLRAGWLYDHNFKQLVVPTEYNSGHPPLWISSIAIFWKVFGKAIWSARLLLLFVNMGAVYQLFLLFKKTRIPQVSILLFLVLCIEPTFIAQTTSLNNDILLLFFTLLGINSLLKNSWFLYAIALTGILFTNLRGIYIAIVLILTHIAYIKFGIQTLKRNMYYSYAIAIVAFLSFLLYQYQELGWVIITKNKSYSQHRESTSLINALKNSIAFAKNLLEYGRFVVWLPLLVYLLKFRKGKNIDRRSKALLIPLFLFLFIFFLGMVPFSNPMGPRYLMICNLLAILLFFNALYTFEYTSIKKKVVIAITVLAFITGHLWIYPATIAQGWDSSLAYLRYYGLEKEMLSFIEQEEIPFTQIGTNLPMHNRAYARAKDDGASEFQFASIDLQENEFYLFSNIENKTQDEEIEILKKEWEIVKEYTSMGVFLTLYKRPN